MNIEPSGWATIDSAPRDGRQIMAWGKQPLDGPDVKPYAAMVAFDPAREWIATDPHDDMQFQFQPTHWLPVAFFDPAQYQDRYGLAAGLEAQGIAIDWNTPDGPTAIKPIDYAYDWRTKAFRVVQM